MVAYFLKKFVIRGVVNGFYFVAFLYDSNIFVSFLENLTVLGKNSCSNSKTYFELL